MSLCGLSSGSSTFGIGMACLGAIAGILHKSEDISNWFRHLFPKAPYDVSITYPSVVPSNLKYFYDSEGLGKRQSLYWFQAKVRNRTRETFSLDLRFTLVPGDCKFVVLESEDPIVKQKSKRSARR